MQRGKDILNKVNGALKVAGLSAIISLGAPSDTNSRDGMDVAYPLDQQAVETSRPINLAYIEYLAFPIAVGGVVLILLFVDRYTKNKCPECKKNGGLKRLRTENRSTSKYPRLFPVYWDLYGCECGYEEWRPQPNMD